MPVEIRELHIKVNVNKAAGSPSSAPSGGESRDAGSGEKQAVIAECVEQVLNILKKQQEK